LILRDFGSLSPKTSSCLDALCRSRGGVTVRDPHCPHGLRLRPSDKEMPVPPEHDHRRWYELAARLQRRRALLTAMGRAAVICVLPSNRTWQWGRFRSQR
jgi:hypothetical protein